MILDSVGASFERVPRFEVISLSPPLPGASELEPMAPDVIVFDVESDVAAGAFSLLETRPDLLLLGISPDGNVVRLWSGRQFHELSTKDLRTSSSEPRAMRSCSRASQHHALPSRGGLRCPASRTHRQGGGPAGWQP